MWVLVIKTKVVVFLYCNNSNFFLHQGIFIVFLSKINENMLQRVQSIYLFLASIATLGIGYYSFGIGNPIYYYGLFALSAMILINIFLFNNRKLQIMLNRLVCVGLIALLGLSLYESGILSGEKQFSEKDIELALPVISIVFLLIANKYIKRDEALVKSVDRIR